MRHKISCEIKPARAHTKLSTYTHKYTQYAYIGKFTHQVRHKISCEIKPARAHAKRLENGSGGVILIGAVNCLLKRAALGGKTSN